MIEQVLTENGFTDKEARVYLAALEMGEAPLSRIATKTRLQRTTVYSLVESMKARGLLTFTKRNGVQYAAALPPRVLIDRFEQAAGLAKQALPMLLDMAYSSPLKPRIRFYDGIEGLKTILREFSQSPTQSLVFTDYEQMPAELFAFIRQDVVKERRKQDVFTRLIVPRNETNSRVQKEDAADKHFAEHRLVDFPNAANPIEILLYDTDKIGLLSFTTKERFGLVIDSLAIHQTLGNLFELIWKGAA